MLVAVDGAPAYAELADVIERIRPSIVGVGAARPVRKPLAEGPPQRFSGTGFVVGNGNQLITNHHVIPTELDVDNEEHLVVFVGRGKDAQLRPAWVVSTDPARDLALLKFAGDPLPTLELADDDRVREGDAIAFTGFPIGVILGLYPATHRGSVSAIAPTVIPAQSSRTLTAAQVKRMKEAFNIYQLDATAYPGNSGSPVYRQSDGVVVAVVNSVYIKETREAILEKPSGITYAIPVAFARALLKKGS
jgi:S1-C subfamily serine protease